MFYKLRAECSQDISNFISKEHSKMLTFSMLKTAIEDQECEFIFEMDESLSEIVLSLQKIENAHVMYQTVNYLTEYTGERNYNI
jgi:hypothetical protein